MKLVRNKAFLLLAFLMPFLVQAQTQFIVDTIDLQSVDIFATTNVFDDGGMKEEEMDSLVMEVSVHDNLATLLQKHTPIYIKNYGPGALATSSFRGAGASHTQVVWNGLNINSPMLGQVDFSQMPVFMFDKVRVLYGGSSIQDGSGGLGGSLRIGNEANWSDLNSVRLSASLASFDAKEIMAGIHLGNEKFLSQTRVSWIDSENDFRFKNNAENTENPPEEIRTDAAWSRKTLTQSFYLKARNNQLLSWQTWLQGENRLLPPPITVTPIPENEKQEQFFVRSVLSYQQTHAKISYKAFVGYVFDQLDYQNKTAYINSVNKVHSFYGGFKSSYHASNKLKLSAAFNSEHHRVLSNNYAKDQERTRFSLLTQAGYHPWKALETALMIRFDKASDADLSMNPVFSLRFLPLQKQDFALRFQLSANTHLPSLNDLYWQPGGNPNLKTEKAQSIEVGVDAILLNDGDSKLKLSLTAYHSDIENKIQWQPDSVFSYWRPRNIASVASNGLETSLDLKLRIGDLFFNVRPSYAFTSAKDDNDKQLIYTPEQSARAFFKLDYAAFSAFYIYDYSGSAYTTSDNLRRMLPFGLHDAGLSYGFQWKRHSFGLHFRCNNILDKSYQVVAWRPMPGRNFRFSLNVKINY